MKKGMQDPVVPLEVKGVPTSKVIELWKEGHRHGYIQRRCHPLS